MSWTWNHPEHDPRDGNPELDSLARLFRDHSPADPSPDTWRVALWRIESRLEALPPRRSRFRWPVLVGLISAAAAATFGGLLLARSLWNAPSSPAPALVRLIEDEDTFPVATLAEVNIIRISPEDADRLVMGQPVFGSFDLATPEEIDILQVDADPGSARVPVVHRGKFGAPLLIVSRDNEDLVSDDDDQP